MNLSTPDIAKASGVHKHWDQWLQKLIADFPQAKADSVAAAWSLVPDSDLARQDAAARADVMVVLGMDADTLAAALLHACDWRKGKAPEKVDPAAQALLLGVRRIEGLTGKENFSDRGEQHAENLRRMLLALVDDVRVVLIKLVDRLQVMRGLKHRKPQERVETARETKALYAPLANRLGIWQIKWELEDLSLRFLEPDDYHRIAHWLHETRGEREEYVNGFIDTLSGLLLDIGFEADISGRAKHIYSIWNKMRRKRVPFDELYDIRAVRVLVDSVEQCYATLGVVHSKWQYIPGEFDDYIARPKPNLYRSLHTAVIGPDGKTIEVQIRTHEMHSHAELGVAAHWRYKEGTHYDPAFEERLQTMRQLLEPGDDKQDSGNGMLESLQADISTERIYVMTPRGDVIDLPHGATPVDFAYTIHSNVGNRTRGAKVNGRIVPLTYGLQSGETVEVITQKHPQPSRDWLSPHLGYTVSGRARSRIRSWFRQQDFDQNLEDGKQLAEQEMRRLGIDQLDRNALMVRFHLKSMEDIYAAMGRGDVSVAQFAGALAPPPRKGTGKRKPKLQDNEGKAVDGIRVEGVGDLLTQFARCCKPVPPEPIVGFITRGRGVTVHRADCPNIENLSDEDQQRLIDVEWDMGAEQTFSVDIMVHAYDRKGLLSDITAVLAEQGVNVTGVHTQSHSKEHTADMKLTVEVAQYDQLSRLFDRIAMVRNVVGVSRAS